MKKFLHTPIESQSNVGVNEAMIEIDGRTEWANDYNDIPFNVLRCLRAYIDQFANSGVNDNYILGFDNYREVQRTQLITPSIGLNLSFFSPEKQEFGMLVVDTDLYFFHLDENNIPVLNLPNNAERDGDWWNHRRPPYAIATDYLEQAIKDIREDIDAWSGFGIFKNAIDFIAYRKNQLEVELSLAEATVKRMKTHPYYSRIPEARWD